MSSFEQKFDLSMKQTQKLKMTLHLQQSIKILQLSTNELNQLVKNAIEENPLLLQVSGENAETDQSENVQNENEEDPYLTSHYYEETKKQTSGNSREQENFLMQETTLRQHLLEQIYVSIACPQKRVVCFNLLDFVDDAGYLMMSENDLCKIKKDIKCSQKDINLAIKTMQNFDPCGVFARNLSECLKLQLAEKQLLEPKIEIILDHLEMIASSDLAKLAKKASCTIEELGAMIKLIRSLNPKPGAKFASETTCYTKPDILVEKEADQLKLSLNSELLPKILLNKEYYVKIKKHSNSQEKRYLSEKLHNANWLLKAIDQRANTMLRVATEIVSRQTAFLEKGIKFLKPLTLSEVAEALEIHESTVSRITTNKYMATPIGTFELKFFFSSKLETDQEDACSSKMVQELIREIISQESPSNVLSDDAIAEKLKLKQINIARRTVAKYRDLLLIPTSSLRKKQKKLLELTENS